MTDEKIYRHLLGNEVVIGAMYNSPIPGRKDDTPSFGLYEKNGEILWKDFGLPHPPGNKAIHLLMVMHNLSLKEAKEKGEEILKSYVGKPVTRFFRKETAIPQLVLREKFYDFELDYWKKFGIFEPQLKKEHIFPLESLKWITANSIYEEVSKKGNPAFIYNINYKGIKGWKRYRPLVKRGKFLTHNLRGGVIEGWDTFSPGELNLIVSSTKDRLVVKNCGYQVINPSGEGVVYPFLDLKLPGRTVILFDSDEPGYAYSEKLAKLTGWEYIDMRGKLRGKKDFAEYKEKIQRLMPRAKKASSVDMNNFYVKKPLGQVGGRKFLDTIAAIGMLHDKKINPGHGWEIVSLDDDGHLCYAGSATYYGLKGGLPFFSYDEPPNELKLTLISVNEWLKRIGS